MCYSVDVIANLSIFMQVTYVLFRYDTHLKTLNETKRHEFKIMQ